MRILGREQEIPEYIDRQAQPFGKSDFYAGPTVARKTERGKDSGAGKNERLEARMKAREETVNAARDEAKARSSRRMQGRLLSRLRPSFLR